MVAQGCPLTSNASVAFWSMHLQRYVPNPASATGSSDPLRVWVRTEVWKRTWSASGKEHNDVRKASCENVISLQSRATDPGVKLCRRRACLIRTDRCGCRVTALNFNLSADTSSGVVNISLSLRVARLLMLILIIITKKWTNHFAVIY